MKEALARRLPDYMIPSFLAFHESFPLTASGKIDRSALPAPSVMDREQGPAAAENPTEARLIEIWEELLGVTGVGRHSDFQALGGESLLAMRIRARIAREFDVQVPAAAFVDAPTIAKQARLVAEARRGLPLDQRLIPIRGTGDRPPIFLVPPAGATVLTFGRLVHHLPTDLPVYGLQPWGIDGEVRPHYSVRAMAADYIREMRRVRPDGPYLIAGMCFGGIVVFEMARQLAQSGAPPALVVVLDTLLPPNMSAGKRMFGLARLVKRYVLRQWSMPDNVIERLAVHRSGLPRQCAGALCLPRRPVSRKAGRGVFGCGSDLWES